MHFSEGLKDNLPIFSGSHFSNKEKRRGKEQRFTLFCKVESTKAPRICHRYAPKSLACSPPLTIQWRLSGELFSDSIKPYP